MRIRVSEGSPRVNKGSRGLRLRMTHYCCMIHQYPPNCAQRESRANFSDHIPDFNFREGRESRSTFTLYSATKKVNNLPTATLHYSSWTSVVNIRCELSYGVLCYYSTSTNIVNNIESLWSNIESLDPMFNHLHPILNHSLQFIGRLPTHTKTAFHRHKIFTIDGIILKNLLVFVKKLKFQTESIPIPVRNIVHPDAPTILLQ